MPFAPSSLSGRRRLHLDRLPAGEVCGRRKGVADERARERVSLVVVDELLVEGLRDAGEDAAVHLALGDQRIDERARVVDRDEALELDLPRLDIDLDDGDVDTERERRRSLEVVLGLQLVEPAVGGCPLGELRPRERGLGCSDDVEPARAVSSTMSAMLASR